MGHDLGDFEDAFKGTLHVEYTGGHMVVWDAFESDQILRLSPENAGKLMLKLKDAIEMYAPEAMP